MKIGVLGGNGYIGSYLVQSLRILGETVAVTRQQVDLLDAGATQQYLRREKFDVVIGAAKHPEYELAPRPDIASHNLNLFTNVLAAHHEFGRYINLGSGAEFDRTRTALEPAETAIWHRRPLDGYGLSRNTISRICSTMPNFYTVRLWGILHGSEPGYKLFRRLRNGQPELVLRDCFFDYMDMQDLSRVIEYFCCTESPRYQDVNAVYANKFLLSDLAEIFTRVHGIKTRISVEPVRAPDYTGSGLRLAGLNLHLRGLLAGMEEYQ